jgi:hypothetical protein
MFWGRYVWRRITGTKDGLSTAYLTSCGFYVTVGWEMSAYMR